jgi:hypothetical protein
MEEILDAIYYDRCRKALDIAINTQIKPAMYEVAWEDEVRGIRFTVKTFVPLDNTLLYISRDPKLTVLIEQRACYYVED